MFYLLGNILILNSIHFNNFLTLLVPSFSNFGAFLVLQKLKQQILFYYM